MLSRIYIISSLVLLLSGFAKAQETHNIQIKVVDESQQGLDSITVALINRITSDTLQTTHTDSLGVAEFANVLVTSNNADPVIPSGIQLSPGYPNPFQDGVSISAQFEKDSEVLAEVYNMLGQRVLRVPQQRMTTGVHALNLQMGSLADGVYFVRLFRGGQVFTQQITKLGGESGRIIRGSWGAGTKATFSKQKQSMYTNQTDLEIHVYDERGWYSTDVINIESGKVTYTVQLEDIRPIYLKVNVFNVELRAQHINDGIRSVIRVIQKNDSTQYISEDGSFEDIVVNEGPLTLRAYFIDDKDSVLSFMRTRRFEVSSSLDVDIYTVPYIYYDENLQETTVDGYSKLTPGAELNLNPEGFQEWRMYSATFNGLFPFNADNSNLNDTGKIQGWQCADKPGVPAVAVVADTLYLPARITALQQGILDERTRNLYVQNWEFMDQALWGELPDIQRVSYIEVDERNNSYPCYVIMGGLNDGNNGTTRAFAGGGSQLIQVIAEARAGDNGAPTSAIQTAVAQEVDPAGSASGTDSNEYTTPSSSIDHDATRLPFGSAQNMKIWRVQFSFVGEDVLDVFAIPIHTSNN